MANTVIQLKYSGVPGNIPPDLSNGEIALNYADGKFYYKNLTGQIVSFSASAASGNVYSFATINANNSLITALSNNSVLTIRPGENVGIDADIINDIITISANLKPAYDTANAAYNYANTLALTSNVEQLTLLIVSSFDQSNIAFSTANAAFDKANAANVLAYDTGIGANAYTTSVSVSINTYTDLVGVSANSYAGYMANAANAYAASLTPDLSPVFNVSNNAYNTANAAYNNSNAVFILAQAAFDRANLSNDVLYVALAYDTANAAFNKANTANVLAYDTGIGANAYATLIGDSANSYAGYMANAANAYAASLTPNLAPAFDVANSAFDKANNAMPTTSNGTQLIFSQSIPLVGPNLDNTDGERIIFWPQRPGGPYYNYSYGLEIDALWFGVDAMANGANAIAGYNWYEGNNLIMRLTRNANLTIKTVNIDTIKFGDGTQQTTAFRYDLLNTAFDVANSAYNNANSTLTLAQAAFDRANTSNDVLFIEAVYNTSNAAFDKANAANVLAYDTGIGANSYTNAVGLAGNNYTNAVGTAGNNYTDAVGLAGNNYTNAVGTAGNNYTDAVGLAGNNYTNAVGLAGNNYVSILVANNAVGANNLANTIGNSANSYAGYMTNSSNSYAEATYVKLSAASQLITGDIGITGNLTISGNVTYANTRQLQVGDNIITLNADLPMDVMPIDNAGIEVNRGIKDSNAALLWIESSGRWGFTGNDAQTISTFIASNTDIGVLNDTVNTVYASSNSNWSVQNSLYDLVNTSYGMGNAAYITLNSSYDTVNANYASSNSNWVVQNLIYATVNASYVMGNATYTTLNAAYDVANAGYAFVNSAYASINSNWSVQNAVYDLANTIYIMSNAAYNTLNATHDTTNAVYASANSNWVVQNLIYATVNANYTTSNATYLTLNSTYDIVNAVYASTNSNWEVQNLVYATVNANYIMSNAGYTTLNAAYDTVNANYASANSNWVVQNLVYATVNASYVMGNAAYDTMNTAYTMANANYDLTNAAYASSNSNWEVQNLVYTTVNASYTLANSAYANANSLAIGANAWSNLVGESANSHAGYMTNSSNSYADATYLKLTSPSQTITGDLSITGNVFLLGNATSIAANNLSINDSLIYLAANNDQSDILDIGFIGHYSNGTANLHTGLYRDHATKQYFLFVDGAGPEPETINDLIPYANGMINAVLHTDLITSNIWLGGANTIHTISSAFDKANAAYNNANVGFAAANAYSDSVGLAGNNYASILAANNAVGANAYTDHVGLSVNTYTSILASNNAIGANAWANTVATAGNNYTDHVGLSVNTYTSILASNNAIGANAWASAVGIAGNNYTNSVGVAGNNYTIALVQSANNWANTKLSNGTVTLAGSLTTTEQMYVNSQITITPLGGSEGGEIRLEGPDDYTDWSLDSYQNNFRVFTVTGSTVSNINFFHAGAGSIRMGINKADPAYTVDVAGDVNITGTYRVNGTPIASGGGSMDYAYVNTSTTAANNYAVSIGASGNSYALTIATNIGTAGNNYASILAANNAVGANGWANTVGTAGNNYTNTVGTAGNNYTNYVGTSANTFADVTYYKKSGGLISGDVGVTGNLTVSGITIFANTQQLQVGDNIITLNADLPLSATAVDDAGIEVNRGNHNGNSALLWIEATGEWGFTGNDAQTISTFIASNTFVELRDIAGNTYTQQVGTAGNNYTNYVGASANAVSATKVSSVTGTSGRITSSGGTTPAIDLATTAVTPASYGATTSIPVITVDAYGRVTYAANVSVQGMDYAYANTIGASANAWSNTKVSSVTGTAGRITSSGGTAPTIDLATAGAGAASYSAGISAITVDAYGRVTSVTGSAGYGAGTVTSVSGTSGRITSSGGTAPAIDLATSGVVASSYGGSTQIPSFVVDAYGRITAAANNAASGGGATITDDNSTNATRYIVWDDATSGSMSTVGVSSTKLTFNPSTGTLSATILNSTSDINKKENIEPIVDAVESINRINGYTFNWKDNGNESIGVIAQEIEKVLPCLVDESGDGKSVNYNGLVAMLIEVVKEQQKEINNIKKSLEGK